MNSAPLVTTFSPGDEAGENFDHPVDDPSGSDRTRGNRSVVPRHPDASRIALVDDRALRHCRSGRGLAGDDAEIGKHPRLQFASGIFDIRAHGQAVRVRVDRWRDPGDLRLEDTAGKGQHVHLNRLADTHQWRVRLSDVGDQPNGRQIADRVDRIRGTAGLAVDILADPDLALGDGAADRRRHRRHRIEFLRRLRFERSDLLVSFAKYAQPAAHRVQGDLVGADGILGGDQIGLGLLPILERAALRQI